MGGSRRKEEAKVNLRLEIARKFLGYIDLGCLMDPVECAFQPYARDHLRTIRLLVEPHNSLCAAASFVGYDILPLHKI